MAERRKNRSGAAGLSSLSDVESLEISNIREFLYEENNLSMDGDAVQRPKNDANYLNLDGFLYEDDDEAIKNPLLVSVAPNIQYRGATAHGVFVGNDEKDDFQSLIQLLKRVVEEVGVPEAKRRIAQWSSSENVSSAWGEVASGQAVSPPLPEKAPRLYAERPKGQNIMDFLRSEYGPWLDGTLTRKRLRELDPAANKAVENWLLTKPLPEDVILPTLKEVNDAALAALPMGPRDAARLASAYGRRARNVLVRN